MSESTNAVERAQLNARIPSNLKSNVKVEAARVKGLTIDKVAEIVLADFFKANPTEASRDAYWKKHMACASEEKLAPQPV